MIILWILLVLTIGYIVYDRFFKVEYDEYLVKRLSIIIYYNREEQYVYADFSRYEEEGEVTVRIYSVKQPTEEERKLEGERCYNDRAIVRCAKGTEEILGW